MYEEFLIDPQPGYSLFVDPGPSVNGWALLHDATILDFGNSTRQELIERVHGVPIEDLLVEAIQPFSNNMSLSWTMIEAGALIASLRWKRCILPRRIRVKNTFKIPRGKNADGYLAQKCREHYGDKGTKKDPGPTYGFSKHAWQALAMSIPYYAGSLKGHRFL